VFHGAKPLSKAQGGLIWAISNGGRGATFHFSLQVARAKTDLPTDAPRFGIQQNGQ